MAATFNARRYAFRRWATAEDFIDTPVQIVDGQTLRSVVHDWLGKRAAKA